MDPLALAVASPVLTPQWDFISLWFGPNRRQNLNHEVEDAVIRIEYTTINAIVKFAERSGLIPFGRCHTKDVTIKQF